MMRGYVIGEERLDVHSNSAARLENPVTLCPYTQELLKVRIPFMRIIMGISGIHMAKIVRGGRNNEVYAVIRKPGKCGLRIGTDDAVGKFFYYRGFPDTKIGFGIFRPTPYPCLAFLVRYFQGSHGIDYTIVNPDALKTVGS
jgi:hypothetical protein